MFFKANESHFQLFWDKSSSATGSSSNTGSSIGDKLSSLASSAKSLDPFSTLTSALTGGLKDTLSNATVETALDKLQVLSFTGTEGISSPYAFEIVLVNKHVRFDITQLLSKSVFLAFTPEGKSGSGIHGIVQSVKRGAVGQHYATFSMVITPRFSNLMRRVNQR